MPATIRKGSTGSDVSLCQGDLNAHGFPCDVDGIFGSGTQAQVIAFQKAQGLAADGIVGPNTWAALEADPDTEEPTDDPTTWEGEKDWSAFVPLLGPAMNATYALSGAQMPQLPPGLRLNSRYIGEATTNCVMFTGYLLGNGFGGPFSGDQWARWALTQPEDYNYQGYGPGVCAEWGVGEMMPAGAVPKDGVYLLQTIRGWPSGHSWMVLDYDEATGKILTLESNTSGTGLNGVGFWNLGPIRSTNAANWKERVHTTWDERIASATEISMCRLAINHQSVLDWIAGQG
jgi:peptidoglycan hydrolase-like protein with peptidoglycan-binding domain